MFHQYKNHVTHQLFEDNVKNTMCNKTIIVLFYIFDQSYNMMKDKADVV